MTDELLPRRQLRCATSAAGHDFNERGVCKRCGLRVDPPTDQDSA